MSKEIEEINTLIEAKSFSTIKHQLGNYAFDSLSHLFKRPDLCEHIFNYYDKLLTNLYRTGKDAGVNAVLRANPELNASAIGAVEDYLGEIDKLGDLNLQHAAKRIFATVQATAFEPWAERRLDNYKIAFPEHQAAQLTSFITGEAAGLGTEARLAIGMALRDACHRMRQISDHSHLAPLTNVGDVVKVPGWERAAAAAGRK